MTAQTPTPGQPAPGVLLCDNQPVMDALMLAIAAPGSITPRAPMEALTSWQRRAVIEHAAPLIIAAQEPQPAAATDVDMMFAEWADGQWEESGAFEYGDISDAFEAGFNAARKLRDAGWSGKAAPVLRKLDELRAELRAAEQENAGLNVLLADAFALVAVLADGNPAAQRQANELRKRAGLKPSPAGISEEEKRMTGD